MESRTEKSAKSRDWLCPTCRNAFDTVYAGYQDGQIITEASKVEYSESVSTEHFRDEVKHASDKIGCTLYRRLLKQKWIDKDVYETTWAWTFPMYGAVRLQRVWKTRSEKGDNHNRQYEDEILSYNLHRYLLQVPFTSMPSPSSSTGSEETKALVRHWFSHCDEKHSCFNASFLPQSYPKRLLDLDAPTLGQDFVRLIESSSEKPTGHYATLSHCWGGNVSLKLSHGSLKGFSHSLPCTALPKTFQEAVVVCRWLRIRYLWIDSLCIMQGADGEAEWHQEAGRMSEVYGNAYCTIAASDSGDSTQGLFRQRHPGWAQPLVRVQPTSEQSTTLSREVMDIVVPSHAWHEQVNSSKLSSRGWVFQERLLSPRTLFFGKEQIFWECHVSRAFEQLPHLTGAEETLMLGDPKSWLGLKTLPSGTSHQLREQQASIARATWPKTVSLFMGCQLTVQSDRLLAISGLAKVIAKWTGDQYVAGLWRSQLPRTLVWTPKYRVKRLKDYIAPSFSWASMDGPIRFHDAFENWSNGQHLDTVIMDIKEVSIRGDDEGFGMSRGDSIQVETYLKHFHHLTRAWAKLRIHLDEENYVSNIWNDNIYTAVVGRDSRHGQYPLILKHCERDVYQRIGLLVAISHDSRELADEPICWEFISRVAEDTNDANDSKLSTESTGKPEMIDGILEMRDDENDSNDNTKVLACILSSPNPSHRRGKSVQFREGGHRKIDSSRSNPTDYYLIKRIASGGDLPGQGPGQERVEYSDIPCTSFDAESRMHTFTII